MLLSLFLVVISFMAAACSFTCFKSSCRAFSLATCLHTVSNAAACPSWELLKSASIALTVSSSLLILSKVAAKASASALDIDPGFCSTSPARTSKSSNKEENNVLQFHIGNLEYACGAPLSEVSALQWDQNERFPQFSGQHALVPDGFGCLLQALAEGLDIRYGHKVTTIDYGSEEGGVQIFTERSATHNGKEKEDEKFSADFALVTVPLAILQQKEIQFSPPLPKDKMGALMDLGAGVIEKVALKFARPFWSAQVMAADFFGHVPSSPEQRGLFSVFFDLSPRTQPKMNPTYVLMTYVSGNAINLIANKKDDEVVSMCMDVLRGIFHDQEVPDPQGYTLTHWRDSPYSYMVYSYVRCGGSGKAYTTLAEPLADRLFFAGEGTSRMFPQTVSGAYMSGLREAWNILRRLPLGLEPDLMLDV